MASEYALTGRRLRGAMLPALAALFACVLALAAWPAAAAAEEVGDAPDAALAAQEDSDIASGTNWRITSDGTLVISGQLDNWTTYGYVPWDKYRMSIKAVTTTEGAKAQTCLYLFYGCENMTSADLSNLDTSGVTSMSYMFSGCPSLTSITGLSDRNTSSVTDMSCMFYSCKSLASLDLSGWDTSKAAYISEMFYYCSSLASLDLSGWDTSSVTDISRMFSGCTAMESITVGAGYDIKGAYMFPDATASSGWYSAADKCWYTKDEIVSGRSGVADTYTSAGEAGISGATISGLSAQTYTGSAITPKPTVKLGSATLTEGTDYALSYANNVSVGTATVTVTGKGSYTGTKSATFAISAASLSGATVSLSQSAYTYSGSACTPGVTVTLGGRTLAAGSDYAVSYSNNVSVGTATVTVTGKGNYTGSKSATFAIQAASPSASRVTMYRVYNPNSGEHFYTASASERDTIVSVGWVDEGVGWVAPSTSSTPVYRLYSGTDHHYTTSAEERDKLISVGWVDEGIGWYSDDAQGTPLYRQFNPNVDPHAARNNSGSHNYTASKGENDYLASIGWIAEGIGWYGMA